MPDARPAGWWNVSNLSGLRGAVVREVNARTDLEKADKDFITAKIAALPAEFNAVSVDAFLHIVGGRVVFDMTLVPGKQLV